jgi:hypothetical protein
MSEIQLRTDNYFHLLNISLQLNIVNILGSMRVTVYRASLMESGYTAFLFLREKIKNWR